MWAEVRFVLTEIAIPRVVNDHAVMLVVGPGLDLFRDRMEDLESPLKTERQQNRQQQQGYLSRVSALRHRYRKSIEEIGRRQYFLLRSGASIQRRQSAAR